jgi:uncharacterized membrane protein
MDVPHSDLEAIRQILADLTGRIYRIERQLGIDARPKAAQSTGAEGKDTQHEETQPKELRSEDTQPSKSRPSPIRSSTPATPSSPSPSSKAPIPPPAFTPPRPLASQQALSDPGLESRIGSHWLNRIGIAAVLIGISYFLKLAFDNNWIGPSGRVTIGLLAGIAVVIWSERFRNKGYKVFSYSLKAVGIGTLYLSLWAAFQVYQLIPSSAAFGMMLAVTGATAAMAFAQDAQILAAFAIAGGFSTPLLLSTGQNREIALFAYVAILDLATLFLVTVKPWRHLLVMSYAGTLLLYVGWYSTFYSRSQIGLTLAFATVFFAIFALAPLFTLQPEGEPVFFASVPAILSFVNAGVYFVQAYVMIEEVDKTYMAWFALALAAVYIFLGRQIRARSTSAGASGILYFLHLAVAVGFVTVAIPIRLDTHWITIGWFIEAGVLLWIGNRIKSDFLNVFALGALILGVVRLLLIDNFHTTQMLFNMRIATYAVAIAVLGAVAYYASRREDEAARAVAAAAIVALNALALIALSREVADYYARQLAAYRPFRQMPGSNYYSYYADLRQIDIERDFTYSALWMAYGAVLMIVGFLRRSAFVRWQALLLIALTIAKVFMHDVFELERGYRIVSFIVLGVLLLAISFVYQRDWLRLSTRAKEQGNTEGNVST